MAARGVGAFYLDIKNLQIAASEAQLEAGTIKNTLLDEMYSDFYHENGIAPTDEQSKEMAKIASSKADDGFYANAAILYMSNKIMFDTLFSSFKVAKNGTQKVLKKTHGKRIIEDTRKGATKRFETQSDNFFSRAKNITKNPKLAAKAVKDYSLINSSEGFQEVLQEGITASAEERGMEEYKGNKLNGYFYSDFLQKSGESLLGSEGWSVFASGFLTGIPMQAVQSSAVGLYQAGYNKTAKGQEAKIKGLADLEKSKDILNEMNEKIDEKFKSRLSELQTDKERIESLGTQKDMSDEMISAVLDENKKAYEDAKSVIFSEYLLNAIESGGADMVSENIESLRDLSEEEIKESFQISKEDFDSKLEHMSNQVALVKELVEYRDNNFVNTYNPSNYDKNDPRREIEALKFSMYENLRKSFVTKNYAFKETLRRMNDINSSFVEEVGIGSAAYSSVEFLLDKDKTLKQIKSLEEELEIYEKSSEKEDKVKSKVIKNKIASLTQYNEATFSLSSETTTKTKGGEQALLKKKEEGYMKYLELVAEENGQLFDQAKAQDSFKKANDYQVLDSESKNLHSDVRLLLDPNFIDNVISNTVELDKKGKQIQSQKDAADLKSFLENEDNHELIKKIYDKFNVFLSPESIDELINKKNMPSRFLENGIGKSKGNISEIDPSSQKYRDVTNFIRTESETKGIKLGNDNVEIPLDMATRKQVKKETYSQLADKFGFESDGSNSEVLIVDILKAIYDDNNTTSRQLEKDLAATLLGLIPEGSKILVTQEKNMPSGISNSGDPFVDARFSASDYVSENHKGEKIPFEISILRAVIDSVVVKELNENAEFKGQMNEIFKKAKSLSKDNKRFEYTNLNIFVKELLVNRDFQMELSQMEGQDDFSLWENFLDVIKKTLDRLFKTKINKQSLLNDAINIIASRLDPSVAAETSDSTIEVDNSNRTQENTKLTFYTTTEDIDSLFEDAHEGLIDLFLKHNESQEYDKNVEEKGDVKINSNGFKKFLNDTTAEVRNDLIIFMEGFNAKSNRTFYPEFKAVSKTDIGFAVRSRLEELGYEPDSFRNRVSEAVKIANSGTTKEDSQSVLNKTKKELQDKINADAKIIEEKIISMFAKVSLGIDIGKTIKDVDKYLDEKAEGYENELGVEMNNFTLLNRSDVDIFTLIEDKIVPETEERLSKELNIKSIRKGMVLKNSKDQFVVVDKIEKGEVFYHVLGNKTEESFKKKDIGKKITSVYAMEMKDTSLNPEKIQEVSSDVQKEGINIQDKSSEEVGEDC